MKKIFMRAAHKQTFSKLPKIIKHSNLANKQVIFDLIVYSLCCLRFRNKLYYLLTILLEKKGFFSSTLDNTPIHTDNNKEKISRHPANRIVIDRVAE